MIQLINLSTLPPEYLYPTYAEIVISAGMPNSVPTNWSRPIKRFLPYESLSLSPLSVENHPVARTSPEESGALRKTGC